jgi:hypothetical protein
MLGALKVAKRRQDIRVLVDRMRLQFTQFAASEYVEVGETIEQET